MVQSLATLTTFFDIDLLSEIEFGSERFGFGVRRPTASVPFRIRRRQ